MKWTDSDFAVNFCIGCQSLKITSIQLFKD